MTYLYYYNSDTKENKKVLGLEESQQITKDTTVFFLKKEEVNDINLDNLEEFYSNIKFNLISRETVSLIGENNNIPEDILNNYYVEARLVSKGKNPHLIYLGNNKEYKPGHGKIHYPLGKYYIKLNSQKGQFDASFISLKEIDLSVFGCEIIFHTFEKIPEKSKILLEFKNGRGGENEVLSQADRYQKNAKVLFRDEEFYHIIIIRSDKLGLALKNKINKIDEKNFANFAILCLNSKLIICGKDISKISEESNDNSKKSKKSKTGSKGPKSETHISNPTEETTKLRNEFSQFKDLMSAIQQTLNLLTEQMKEINNKLNISSNDKNNNNNNNNI